MSFEQFFYDMEEASFWLADDFFPRLFKFIDNYKLVAFSLMVTFSIPAFMLIINFFADVSSDSEYFIPKAFKKFLRKSKNDKLSEQRKMQISKSRQQGDLGRDRYR